MGEPVSVLAVSLLRSRNSLNVCLEGAKERFDGLLVRLLTCSSHVQESSEICKLLLNKRHLGITDRITFPVSLGAREPYHR